MHLIEQYHGQYNVVIGMFDSGLYSLYDDFAKYEVYHYVSIDNRRFSLVNIQLKTSNYQLFFVLPITCRVRRIIIRTFCLKYI